MSKKFCRIGEYWLSERLGRPSWYRTWFDHETRQTKRSSLGTGDLREAEMRLAEWVATNGRMRDELVTETLLETVLHRYWERHACHVASARKSTSFTELLVRVLSWRDDQ